MSWFERFAVRAACATGSSFAFCMAFVVVIIWAALGPTFGYSETWQLVINTGTTIVTFLMVFLIQASQNRDTRAIHAKLDEVIHAIREADDRLIGIEGRSREELEEIRKQDLGGT